MKAKAQADLPFAPPSPPSSDELRDLGVSAWRHRVLPAVRAAVERLSAKEAGYLFDVKASYLSDALAERDSKGVRLEWLVIMLVAAPEAVRLELLTELCRVAGYKAPERARELTPEEELRIYRAAVKRLAPGIAPAIEREIEEA